MRYFLISTAIVALIFAGCGQKSQKPNTHTHEDGSVHSDHAEQPTPEQETFVVATDSLTTETDSLSNHKPEQNPIHEHDGKPHKH